MPATTPAQDSSNTAVLERIETVIVERRQLGIEEAVLIKASDLEATTFAHIRATGSERVSALELSQFCRGLFIYPDWLLTGTASVVWSPCSLERLLQIHYAPFMP